MYFRNFNNHHRTGNLFVDPSNHPIGQTKDDQFFKLRIPKKKKKKTITRFLISSTIKKYYSDYAPFHIIKVFNLLFLKEILNDHKDQT